MKIDNCKNQDAYIWNLYLHRTLKLAFLRDAECWRGLGCILPALLLQMFVLILFLMREWHGFAYFTRQALLKHKIIYYKYRLYE